MCYMFSIDAIHGAVVSAVEIWEVWCWWKINVDRVSWPIARCATLWFDIFETILCYILTTVYQKSKVGKKRIWANVSFVIVCNIEEREEEVSKQVSKHCLGFVGKLWLHAMHSKRKQLIKNHYGDNYILRNRRSLIEYYLPNIAKNDAILSNVLF